jgi:hypothetical protein
MIQKLSSIFNKAIEFGWSHINPVTGIKKFNEASRDLNIDPRKELESITLRDTLEKHKSFCWNTARV